MESKRIFQMNGATVTIERITQHDFFMNQDVTLYFVLAGHLEIIQNGQIRQLNSGDIYLVNHKEIIGLVGSKDNTVVSVCLRFNSLQNEAVAFQLNRPLSWAYRQDAYPLIARCLASLIIEWLKKETGYQAIADGELSRLKGLLLRHIPNQSQAADDGVLISSKNNQIVAYINDHFHEKISLSDLSERFYVSKFYLAHSFKQQIGLSVGSYLKEIRLLHSLELLEKTDETLTDIALKNGFASLRAFSDAFKEKYQESPSAYRKSRQQDRITVRQGDTGSDWLYELLCSYLPEEDRDEFDTRHTMVITEAVDMQHVTRKTNQTDYFLKTQPEYLPVYLERVNKELGIRYVAVQPLVKKINQENRQTVDFNPIGREIAAVLAAGMLPYIQIGAIDYDDYCQLTDAAAGDFVDLLRQFASYLRLNFERLDNWRIEFRCFYEYTNGAELCVPVRDSIPVFQETGQLLIHFPMQPFDVQEASDSGVGEVYTVDDRGMLRQISLVRAMKNLNEPKYIETISQNRNIMHQAEILARFNEYETDDYFQQYQDLIQANRMLWLFLNEFDGNSRYSLPVSLDGSQLFTYFPEALSAKMALIDNQGLIQDSWYCYHFLAKLYDDIVFRNEFCIITKEKGNYRILSVYPEAETAAFFSLNDSHLQNSRQSVTKQRLSFRFVMSGLSGNYRIIQQELTPAHKKAKKTLTDIDDCQILSLDDVVYLNTFNQPVRSVKQANMQEDYVYQMNVPLFGINFTEFIKLNFQPILSNFCHASLKALY